MVVVAVVAALVATKLAGGGSGGAPREPLPPAAAAKLTSVPLTTLLAGGAKQPVTWPSSISQPPLTAGGKPEMLYIGAEFCPICATQRWPMVVALSHFGTFSNLQQTHSAVSDGNIPTLSFYGSTFTSPYLTFTPVETTTNQPSGGYYKPLEMPTAAQNALWQANSPNGTETFPFIDIGGKWLLQTSQFPATELEGKSFNDILGSVGQQQQYDRCLHRRLGRGPDPEDLHRHRPEARRHLRRRHSRPHGSAVFDLRSLLVGVRMTP